jgi:hypothetical protein
VRSRHLAAGLVVAAFIAGCGSSSKPKTRSTTSTAGAQSIPASKLEASMKAILITRYTAPQPVTVQCNSGTVRFRQVLECDVISSAGRGYRVLTDLPCWTATFNGKIIEGPGFLPPGQRPKRPIATGPSNLPNKFFGCVKPRAEASVTGTGRRYGSG